MRRRVIAVLALALLPALASQTTHAQVVSKSITLSPSSTAITVEPKVTANRNITLINSGNTPYTVVVDAAPYRVQGEDYEPLFSRMNGTTDASQWITLSQKSVTLAAGQTVTVPYTVTVPAATAPGGYYAVIFAETGRADGPGVSTRTRVGNILYITVDGTVTQKGSAVSAETPFLTFGNGITLGTRVTNDGGVHFQTAARFTASNLFGANVLDKTDTLYVLPQTTRHITEQFEPKGFGGIYKIGRSATVAGKLTPLPDSWIVVIKPQVIPLVIFGLLTIIGFVILLHRTRRRSK